MDQYNYNSPNIIEEVKNLISYSICNPNLEDPGFKDLHRIIIEKYFEAKNVKIDYEAQTVDMRIPVGKKQYTSITFECQELERFLKACLKKDEKSLDFYENLLSQYSTVSAA